MLLVCIQLKLCMSIDCHLYVIYEFFFMSVPCSDLFWMLVVSVSKWVIGCFTVLQQQGSLAPTIGVVGVEQGPDGIGYLVRSNRSRSSWILKLWIHHIPPTVLLSLIYINLRSFTCRWKPEGHSRFGLGCPPVWFKGPKLHRRQYSSGAWSTRPG